MIKMGMLQLTSHGRGRGGCDVVIGMLWFFSLCMLLVVVCDRYDNEQTHRSRYPFTHSSQYSPHTALTTATHTTLLGLIALLITSLFGHSICTAIVYEYIVLYSAVYSALYSAVYRVLYLLDTEHAGAKNGGRFRRTLAFEKKAVLILPLGCRIG
jgi:hypothetical protein